MNTAAKLEGRVAIITGAARDVRSYTRAMCLMPTPGKA
jgi:hypothetical protein